MHHQEEQNHSGIVNSLLMRMFGRPKGILGRLGGFILAGTKRDFTKWVIQLLNVQPNDKVLEVGFDPGVGIEMLALVVSKGYVSGVDSSQEMNEQARARNAKAIDSGSVRLEYGFAEALPFADDTFDKALTINSMQVWTDVIKGLEEMRRVIKVGGKVAFGFTPASGQSSARLSEILATAGFSEEINKVAFGFTPASGQSSARLSEILATAGFSEEINLVETKHGFCVLVTK